MDVNKLDDELLNEIKQFVAESDLSRDEMLKMVRNWRQIQAGSSHDKCGGCSSDEEEEE